MVSRLVLVLEEQQQHYGGLLRAPVEPLQQSWAKICLHHGVHDSRLACRHRPLRQSKRINLNTLVFELEFNPLNLQVIYSCDATVPEVTNEMFGYDPKNPPRRGDVAAIEILVNNYLNVTRNLKQEAWDRWDIPSQKCWFCLLHWVCSCFVVPSFDDCINDSQTFYTTLVLMIINATIAKFFMWVMRHCSVCDCAVNTRYIDSTLLSSKIIFCFHKKSKAYPFCKNRMEKTCSVFSSLGGWIMFVITLASAITCFGLAVASNYPTPSIIMDVMLAAMVFVVYSLYIEYVNWLFFCSLFPLSWFAFCDTFLSAFSSTMIYCGKRAFRNPDLPKGDYETYAECVRFFGYKLLQVPTHLFLFALKEQMKIQLWMCFEVTKWRCSFGRTYRT